MNQFDNFGPLLIWVAVIGQIYAWANFVAKWREVRLDQAFLESQRLLLARLNGPPTKTGHSQRKRSLVDWLVGAGEVIAYFVIPSALYGVHWIKEFPISLGSIVVLLFWCLIPIGMLLRLKNQHDLIGMRLFNTKLELRKYQHEQT